MNASQVLQSKFERVLALTEEERAAIAALPLHVVEVKADEIILREGVPATRSSLLIEGLACSSKGLGNGRRQILAFHIPFDTPDLVSFLLEVRDCDILALTDCTLAYVEHRDLLALCTAQPRLALDLWRTTLVDAAVHREWTLNVGQREGLSRLAHVFCEMMTRMELIGRARDKSCALPLTQQDLAEATGQSNVHVNRTLQELRRQELLSFVRGQLTIHDWDGLVAVAEFRTEYLHIPATRAA
jgi:CRP-like cAMP-binding protein